MSATLCLKFRSQELGATARGYADWHTVTTERSVPADRTAIVICDMWDNHWSRAAAERADGLATRMNEAVKTARAKGVHIIHAPSDVTDFYAAHPARERARAVPRVAVPAEVDHVDLPLPVDDSDGGSDSGEKPWHKAWTRQHPALEIREGDYLSDGGAEIYSILRQAEITETLIMGVHTGMCILHRSFGIKQMVRWGVRIALVRDLTDAMYNPARSPYVSHAEGTQLIIGYIEKFWCPTVVSADLAG